MKLSDLLAGIISSDLGGARELNISGVYDDSRRVRPGGLFVAVPGVLVDGRRYVAEALARGAVAVVAEGGGGAAAAGSARQKAAIMLAVDNARAALARLAARWYGLDDPALACKLLAVTGTNGKSTTVFMVHAIYAAAGLPCGMLGTIRYDLCGRRAPANLTTPGALQLAAMLRECVDHGAAAIALEASSHALDQHRTAGLRLAAAAFTNLTQDHLDYHADMDAYASAKARLFEQIGPGGVAVVNGDDPYHARMLRDFGGRAIRYGMDPALDLSARVLRGGPRGTSYRLIHGGDSATVDSALIGQHNVYNALAAAGLTLAAGIPLETIAAGLQSLGAVPGRLQRVADIRDLDVFVDYAHTPDALENVCRTLRPLARRRLIVVFGCGGDRDRGKRPLMGQAAARHAQAVIVTSDNPRSEAPERIIADILAGYDAGERHRVLVEPDRRQAIGAALAAAQAGDIVLLAGKGHEDYQLIGDQRLAFDDVQVVQEMAGALQEAAGL